MPDAITTSIVLLVLLFGIALSVGTTLTDTLEPVIAIHFWREAERKAIPVDFLFLLAALAGVGSIWQLGLSAAPRC